MLEEISKLVGTYSVLIRVVFKDGSVSDWSKWMTFPSPGYGEITRHGPFQFRDVEFIEINPIEIRTMGKRVSEKSIDHSKKLIENLQYLNIDHKQSSDLIRITITMI